MNNRPSEHRKSQLYWLTIVIMYTAFVAVVLT